MSQCSGSYVGLCGIAKIFVDLTERIMLRIASADLNAGTILMHDRNAYRRKPRAVAQAARLDVSMRDAVVVLLGLIILILVIGKSGVMV
jgi:hypothetical protein